MRDKKVKLLRAEFGASSVVFVLYVFCRAFEGDGYFLKWDKDECLIAADELKESPAYISEVLQGCLARSLFDQRVYQMFGILTSAGIQRRYLRGCEKRDGIEIASEYWLLNVDDKNDVPAGIRAKLTFFTVSGGKNGVNSPGNPINSPGNPQSKVKESKVKKSKHIYGEFRNVLLSDEEHEKLKKRFKDYKKRIEDLSYYIGSTGKSYKSHYLTILKWARDEKERERNNDTVKRGKETLQSDLEYESYSEEEIEKMMSEEK